MSRTGNDRAFELFDEAADMPPEQRRAFLDEQCGGDEKLRRVVEDLLSADDTAGAFLSDPAFNPAEVAARMVGEEKVGTRIGHYKLLELIGEGGFGRVFLAEQDRPVRRKVALKIIKLGMDTRQVIARFEAERQAVAMMDHPNIARVFDAGATVTGRPYFVMELVKGVPITRYCDEHRLTIRQRLELFVPVCHAVQHAHQKGIIHRDLKPSNVLVTLIDGKPVPKIIDFGIAKATQARLTERTIHTEFHHFVGTPAYMSPEQAAISGDDIDTRSDVYSLGVLLYELLTGSTPFDPQSLRNATYVDVQRMIQETSPQRPSTRLSSSVRDTLHDVASARGGEPAQIRHVLRGELDWITMKCLEKQRSRRYESVSALAGDLLAYLSNRPVAAAPPSRLYQARKFVQQHALSIGAAAAVVTALAAGLVFSVLSLQKLRVEQQRTREALIEAERRRQEAQAAVETSTAINDFVNDMLGSADPYAAAGGRDITVTEALGRSAGQIRDKFADRPMVEIGIRETIGRTFSSLRKPAPAAAHLEAAHELRKTLGLADTPEYLPTKATLAVELHNVGRFPPAQALFKEVVKQARQELERSGNQIVPAVDVLARSASYVDAPGAELEALFALAADRREQLLGKDHPDALVCRMTAAWYMALQEKSAPAEEMLRDVLARMRRVLGPADRQTLVCQDRLARLSEALGRKDEALALQRDAVAAAETQYGLAHPVTLDVMHNLASLLNKRGEYAEVIDIQRRRLAGTEEVYGPDSQPISTVCTALAEAYERSGDEEQAMRLRRRGLDANRKANGPESLSVLLNEAFFGEKLHRDGQHAEAVALFDHAVPRLRMQVRADSPRLMELLGVYAMILDSVGRSEEAMIVAREAFERAEQLRGSANARQLRLIAPQYAVIGILLAKHGKFDEAEPHLRRAMTELRATKQEKSGTMSQVLLWLERACRQTGRADEAAALAAELSALRAATQASTPAPGGGGDVAAGRGELEG